MNTKQLLNEVALTQGVRKRSLAPVLKVLFIEMGLEEKTASAQLEALTSRLLGINCIFTIIPNCFLALETCEHTDFDGIFICGHSLKHITAFDFLRIFRSVGGLAPIFVISDYYDDVEIEDWAINGTAKSYYQFTDPPRFNGKLHKPFTKKELCSSIAQLYHVFYGSQTTESEDGPLKDVSNLMSPSADHKPNKRFQVSSECYIAVATMSSSSAPAASLKPQQQIETVTSTTSTPLSHFTLPSSLLSNPSSSAKGTPSMTSLPTFTQQSIAPMELQENEENDEKEKEEKGKP